MAHPLTLAAAALLLASALVTTSDDFGRERGGANDAAKDALEGRRPPALVGRDWLNVDTPPRFEELVGSVVLLDFWGTW